MGRTGVRPDGAIDLDPAQLRRRGAADYRERRLVLPWGGRVWLNPPYSRVVVANFALKLETEFDRGRARQAVMLVNAQTDAKWFSGEAARFPAPCTEGPRALLIPPARYSAMRGPGPSAARAGCQKGTRPFDNSTGNRAASP